MQISEYQIFIKEHSLQFHGICDSTCLLNNFTSLIDNFQFSIKKGFQVAKMQINDILLCKKKCLWSFPNAEYFM